jgi:hypothetical protein
VAHGTRVLTKLRLSRWLLLILEWPWCGMMYAGRETGTSPLTILKKKINPKSQIYLQLAWFWAACTFECMWIVNKLMYSSWRIHLMARFWRPSRVLIWVLVTGLQMIEQCSNWLLTKVRYNTLLRLVSALLFPVKIGGYHYTKILFTMNIRT